MKQASFILLLAFWSIHCFCQNQLPSSGNIGIGTSNPLSKLSVDPLSQSLANRATIFVAGDHSVLGNQAGSYLYPFEFQHSNTANIDRLLITPYRRNAGNSWEGTAYRLQFAVDNSFTTGGKAYVEIGAGDTRSMGGGFLSFGTEGHDRLTINSAGYVGIGTLNPQESLTVNGKIRAKEVKVETDIWPDYVFEKGYKLMPLKELRSFIYQNNHLPDVPSAREATRNGIDLGEMNRILLRKVEELTLYILKRDEHDEKLQEEIKQLRAMIEHK